MPKWYFSKEGLLRTPSRLDGIDFMTEARYRREGARFIMDCGNKMKLRIIRRYDTMATGAVYFHRFYMIQSFKNFPRWVTGAACLFLAGKVEETPKKCKDVIRMARSLLPDTQFEAFGEDPREEVMMYERILLQTIKFDLQVEHPYQTLLKFGKALKGDRDKLNKLVQMGWTFINDSLSMTLCLRYKPEVIAVGMLYLAGRLNNYDLQSATSAPPGKPWWSAFVKNVTEAMLEEICDVMLELYGGKKKEKDKVDASDHSADSSNTSSPAGYSPSTKKRRTTSASEPKSSATSDLKSDSRRTSAGTPPVTQVIAASQPQLQVENISPAPTPGQIPTAVTTTTIAAPTEQSQTVQGNDTFASLSTMQQEAIPQPPTTDAPKIPEAPPPAAPLPPLSSLSSFPTGGTFGSVQSYLPTANQTSSSYLASSFQPNYGQGTMPSYQLNTQFQTQSFLPPTMGYTMTQPAQPATFPTPVQPAANSSLYAIPVGNLNALQNPPNFGTPPPVRRPPPMGQSTPNVPPPPMPPLSGGQMPLPPQMTGGSQDFVWPRQFGIPPTQQANMGGGWMR